MRSHLFLTLALLAFLSPISQSDITIVRPIAIGSSAESAMLVPGTASVVSGAGRLAQPGTAWTWKVPAAPGARSEVRFRCDPGQDDLGVTVVDWRGQMIDSTVTAGPDGLHADAVAPSDMPIGETLRFRFAALDRPLRVDTVRWAVVMPDNNGDGVPDFLIPTLGLAAGSRFIPEVLRNQPKTTFQTGLPWSSQFAPPTDSVLVYTDNADTIRSWREQGYVVQTMGGFRDGAEKAATKPDDMQRDRAGNPITIDVKSHYMLPTEERNRAHAQSYVNAIKAGGKGAAPEEPEIFARAGYSESFKKEWQAAYGSPWEPPHTSIYTAEKSESLKQKLTIRQIDQILTEVQKADPTATRAVALHSPITYYDWGITAPHVGLIRLPSVQEIIGQVWTGTARSPNRSAGVRTERTFELAFLEYASLNQLVKGTGKKLWFLMDPVEDHPGRTLQDYKANYEQTLIASLFFPEVTNFEVMPWPNRIYGRVTPAYATEVNNIVGALSDLQTTADPRIESGTQGIATVVADSMGRRRVPSLESDFDGFYALTMPLITHGVPVDVLSLDRLPDPGYLKGVRTLLISYDFLQPDRPEINSTLVDFVKRGGNLVVFGAGSPYDNLKGAWWQSAGFASPAEALLSDLGVRPKRGQPQIPEPVPARDKYVVVAEAPANGPDARTRKSITIDLTNRISTTGSVCVRLEDVTTEDGFGPAVHLVELTIDGKPAASFRAGSELETRFLAEEKNTRFNGETRFADRFAYWIYRFDSLPAGKTIKLTVDIENGYRILAAPAGPRAAIVETDDAQTDATLRKVRVSPAYATTNMEPTEDFETLYRWSTNRKPIVWRHRIGSGRVTVVGITPAYFSLTAQTSRLLRDLVRKAHEAGLGTYQEKADMWIRRGQYKAVRTFGKELEVEGRYINLLSPTLNVVEDPEIPARSWALLMDAPKSPQPKLLAASGRITARSESAEVTAWIVKAPEGTEGVSRLQVGKRKPLGVKAFSPLGQPLPVQQVPDGETLLLKYANDNAGVILVVRWSSER